MSMHPTEDPKQQNDTRIYDELRIHRRHVRRDVILPDSCRLCRVELDMIRQGQL